MSSFLERMRASSQDRLERARATAPEAEVKARALDHPPTPLIVNGFAIIAEVKPSSPSEGDLGGRDQVGLALSYQAGGATAISVLTEPTEFGGSLALLGSVASRVRVPVMRKDFLVDPYQVWEARAHGADGVLGIARLFGPTGLSRLVASAVEAELFMLLEAFDEADIELVASVVDEAPGVLIGVNARDLETLEVRRDAHQRMLGYLPSGMTAIAESGIESVGQVRSLARLGYNGVLVGTTLMRSVDPGDAVREMVNAAVEQ